MIISCISGVRRRGEEGGRRREAEEDLLHDHLLDLRGEDGGGGVGPHAPRVGPRVAVPHALVVLGPRHRDGRLPGGGDMSRAVVK